LRAKEAMDLTSDLTKTVRLLLTITLILTKKQQI